MKKILLSRDNGFVNHYHHLLNQLISIKKKRHYEQATLPDGEIAINRLQWLPNSHDFWVNDKGSIFMYSADDLNTKKRF